MRLPVASRSQTRRALLQHREWGRSWLVSYFASGSSFCQRSVLFQLLVRGIEDQLIQPRDSFLLRPGCLGDAKRFRLLHDHCRDDGEGMARGSVFRLFADFPSRSGRRLCFYPQPSSFNKRREGIFASITIVMCRPMIFGSSSSSLTFWNAVV
jgi:hypothetical protein